MKLAFIEIKLNIILFAYFNIFKYLYHFNKLLVTLIVYLIMNREKSFCEKRDDDNICYKCKILYPKLYIHCC